ncbi:nucleolar protein 56 [Panulirus ornatus]|uniref:nucleolar protein 56 n=1 Tax=Panulirus ornatus TaxID=150431 RepID=UPI003A87E61D
MTQLYVLFEHASGFCLFLVKEFEEVGTFLPQVEEAVTQSSKFQQVVKLVGFKAFSSAASALENINAVSEGLLTETLSAFLEVNLPKPEKKNVIQLGVSDAKLGAAISEALKISVTHIGVVPEVVRGIRTHLTFFIKGLTPASMKQTELGLGHSYSRGKVKFNVNRVDNMIIQSIAIVDQLDKDINTFAMRIKEWYSYHFPELARIVTDNYQYALCADFIKDRNTFTQESVEKLEEILMDSAKAQAVFDASKMTMGMDISPIDLMNIERFVKRVIGLSRYRKELAVYLKDRMSSVAPNLSVLIGEIVGARLISHAGSLTNLAKYPASTVQILGAEKALFRAIKTRSNTPKYGLIFHSSFISRAATTNKGRISRYLANKCSLASRIDCFTENLTSVFGEKLRDQVEERLKFFDTGDLPRKNNEVMSEALVEHNNVLQEDVKTRKRKLDEIVDDKAVENDEAAQEVPKKKKKKKNKQEVKETVPVNDVTVAPEEEALPDVPEEEALPAVPEEEALPDVPEEEAVAEAAVNGPIKKKKKKKKKKTESTEVHEPQVNGGEELMEEVPGKEVPKEKEADYLEVQNDMNDEEPVMETVPTALGTKKNKKKKKKKAKQEVSE